MLLLLLLQAEEKVAFTVQVLKEVCALMEEDDSSSSWEEVTVENFLSVVNKQADELLSCVGPPRSDVTCLSIICCFTFCFFSSAAADFVLFELFVHQNLQLIQELCKTRTHPHFDSCSGHCSF